MTAIMIILLSTAVVGFVVSSPLELRTAPDTGIKPLADNDDVNYRLGDNVVPTRYEIFIKPTFKEVSQCLIMQMQISVS